MCLMLAHVGNLLVFLRHLNSCADRLKLGSRRVASNSIASLPCSVAKAGLYIPFGFLGVFVALWSVSLPFEGFVSLLIWFLFLLPILRGYPRFHMNRFLPPMHSVVLVRFPSKAILLL